MWVEGPLNFYHYRDKDKVEVDVIFENARGDCSVVEVKAAATLNVKDFCGLKRFQSVADARIKISVLIYALPLGAIWS